MENPLRVVSVFVLEIVPVDFGRVDIVHLRAPDSPSAHTWSRSVHKRRTNGVHAHCRRCGNRQRRRIRRLTRLAVLTGLNIAHHYQR